LRYLRGSPQFTLRTSELRGAIARLHGSVRHERQLVYRFDVTAGGFCHISNRIQGDTFLRRSLLQAIADRPRTQLLVRSFIPGNIQNPYAFPRAPNRVGDNRHGGVVELAYVADAGNLSRFFVVDAVDFASSNRAASEHRVY